MQHKARLAFAEDIPQYRKSYNMGPWASYGALYGTLYEALLGSAWSPIWGPIWSLYTEPYRALYGPMGRGNPILLTGATGGLGARVLSCLLARGSDSKESQVDGNNM